MPDTSRKAGTLFVVATPMGNLADMTFRAVQTLKAVDLIAAEDTRVSRKLLQHYAITVPMVAYHDHNEREQAGKLLVKLLDGSDIALITDAGTPLVSDPGYRLVSAAHEHELRVVPIPGCCAAIAALSASGLATDRFVFEGFLSPRQGARRRQLEQLLDQPRTLVFYESSHRILDTLADLTHVFGADRVLTLAREISKRYETIARGAAGEIQRRVQDDPDQRRGEFVILVQGSPAAAVDLDGVARTLKPLMSALPLKQAVALTAEITGHPKNEVYRLALESKT